VTAAPLRAGKESLVAKFTAESGLAYAVASDAFAAVKAFSTAHFLGAIVLDPASLAVASSVEAFTVATAIVQAATNLVRAVVAVKSVVAQALSVVALTVATAVLRASFDSTRSTGPSLFTVALASLFVTGPVFLARALALFVFTLRAQASRAVESREALLALAHTVAACTVATAVLRTRLGRVRCALIARPPVFAGTSAIRADAVVVAV
jgi:hypothetical protein